MEVQETKPETKNSTWSAMALAWELGYTIAIPIVVFAIAGRMLDKRFDSSPLFLLLGIFLALLISGIGVYRKTVKILNKV